MTKVRMTLVGEDGKPKINTDSESYQTGYVFSGQSGWNSREEAWTCFKGTRRDVSKREFNAGWDARRGKAVK